MGRGRKVQREWSKKPGFNKQATSVFSDSSPQGEVLRLQLKKNSKKSWQVVENLNLYQV